MRESSLPWVLFFKGLMPLLFALRFSSYQTAAYVGTVLIYACRLLLQGPALPGCAD